MLDYEDASSDGYSAYDYDRDPLSGDDELTVESAMWERNNKTGFGAKGFWRSYKKNEDDGDGTSYNDPVSLFSCIRYLLLPLSSFIYFYTSHPLPTLSSFTYSYSSRPSRYVHMLTYLQGYIHNIKHMVNMTGMSKPFKSEDSPFKSIVNDSGTGSDETVPRYPVTGILGHGHDLESKYYKQMFNVIPHMMPDIKFKIVTKPTFMQEQGRGGEKGGGVAEILYEYCRDWIQPTNAHGDLRDETLTGNDVFEFVTLYRDNRGKNGIVNHVESEFVKKLLKAVGSIQRRFNCHGKS